VIFGLAFILRVESTSYVPTEYNYANAFCYSKYLKMKIPNDLKTAIINMPDKEKDKLLIRLVSKNIMLLNQLHFKLLEESGTTEERREEIENKIIQRAKYYPERYYSPGYLMMEMRDISGLINEHVSITKDKVGEVELQLLMLNELIRRNKDKLAHATSYKRSSLDNYVVLRAKKMVNSIAKFHDDLLINFYDQLQALGKLFQDLNLTNTAEQNGFSINLLLNPDDINP